jgi:thiamine-phosphate pyrophosphorylase
MPQVDFRLMLITDRRGAATSLLTVVERALLAGVRAVQLREKDLTAKACHELAGQIGNLCRQHHAYLLINDRIDIALTTGAAGTHLPANGIPVAAAREFLPRNMLLGLSAHTVAEAAQAEQSGADYVIFGPIYRTASKVRYGPPMGIEKLAELTGVLQIPVLAIGGITPVRAAECLSAGAFGVAAITALLAAPEVGTAVSNFKANMGSL